MENEVNKNESFSKKSVKKLIFFLGVFIFIVVLGLGLIRYRGWHEQKIAKVFLHEIIDSARNQTRFYIDNSTERAAEELRTSIGMVPGNYEVIIMDYFFDTWDCLILFENKRAFKTQVVFEKNRPILKFLHLESQKRTEERIGYKRRAQIKDINKPENKEALNETK